MKGPKVGLEFHQRLASHKLFCGCESALEEKPCGSLVRRLRPVAGELGEVDPAAAAEFLRRSEFAYQVFSGATDLVELDEQPPELNDEALGIALEVSLLLNCRIVGEVYVMRKTVIDGSSVSGFQRTSLIGTDGFYDSPAGRIPITGVYLEEESAGIVEQAAGRTAYRLDRLCMPLVEVSTGLLEGLTPAQVKEAALALGRLLRVTGKVMRGLGTIRQDVNISVPGGARVEIKGVQDVRLLDKVVEYEALRQQRLIELKRELEKRKAGRPKTADFSTLFAHSQSRLFSGRNVQGLLLKGWKGLLGFELCPGRRFGTELAAVAKAYGLGGIVHSDEDLAKYGIASEAVELRKAHRLADDAFVLAAGDRQTAEKAVAAMARRAELAFSGVSEETRRALPDAATEYMRPLPGAERLYPETDLPPIPISGERLAEIKKRLPKRPEKIFSELVEKYGLGEELAERIVTSPRRELFYKACALGVPSTVAAGVLESVLRQLRREGAAAEFFTEQRLLELFRALKQSAFSKEAVAEVLRTWAKTPKASLPQVLKQEGVSAVSEAEIRKTAKALVKEKAKAFADRQRAFNALMGELMKQYRGRADGGLIAQVLRKELGLAA